MNKPNFRPIQQPLAVPDAALERLNDRMGVPVMTRPDTTRSDIAQSPRPMPKTATPARIQEKLSVELPTYLMDAMKQEALTRKVSVRHLVMIALKGLGLEIEPEDLVPDARRSAYKGRTPASL